MFAKVMFLHLSVSHSVHRGSVCGSRGMHGGGACRVGGGVHGRGRAYMAGEGVCGRGACLVGMCMAGGPCMVGVCMAGACVAGGMHGWGMCAIGRAWQGVRMADRGWCVWQGGVCGREAYMVCTSPLPMQILRDTVIRSMSASYWNAFLFTTHFGKYLTMIDLMLQEIQFQFIPLKGLGGKSLHVLHLSGIPLFSKQVQTIS